MLDAMMTALSHFTQPQHLMYLVLGVGMGMIVGILPGLGGIVGLSLLLPFIYGMDQISALAMLIGLVAVIPTSDTFTSVLMGIPGSSASQATVLDGFPLAKKGHGARALGAAFSASLVGGLVGAIILTGFVVIARPLILAFGSAELFMLAVLGLSMVGVLAGKSLPKGIVASGLGLLLGALGAAPATGELRMSFDSVYLMDGLPLVIVGLGMFAFPEIIDLCRQNRSIADNGTLGSGWKDGVRDMIRHKWLCLRCAGLGSIVGALPGLGGSVVDWIAYGHVVQTAKDKSQFGKGDIRGVLAPESANNAKEGGGLVPTLLFGIPGSGSMAVFLGGMVLIGLEAGPAMVGRDLDITYTIIWSLAIANVVGAGGALLLSPFVSKLTTIKYGYLAPFMITIICFAAFQATRSLSDMIALLALGVLGVLMKRFGWPRPAFLIGFVLASNTETYLYQALQFYDWGFLTRPGVMIILALTIISIIMGMRKHPVNPVEEEESSHSHSPNRTPQILFAGLILAIFALGIWDATQHTFLGSVFTGAVSVVMFVVTAVLIWQLVVSPPSHGANFDHEFDLAHGEDKPNAGLWHYVLWVGGMVAGTALFGFLIAITAFFIAFLRLKAGASWLRTLLLTALAMGGLCFLAWALVLDFPGGLLQDLVDLPWPLG
ncbi:tripartite tricarboxylate transporter permease [Thalassospira sp. TSL5-1]|uniref:tripartite tricarboxylate transporter permease n=1 Tax=Thalassospira sp. TSL5-1 TaxID=1544451 RepID=UPI00093EDDCF|nr:tripartite tricarboxylate transporter permease [Thalassospira sp. TSL5-1]OKH86705.1 tricarboxylate transporter [Thalassospira sp. TSL5-1]